MNGARISLDLVDDIEEARHFWTKALADKVVTPAEAAAMSSNLIKIERKANRVDQAIEFSVSISRRGPDSERARRLAVTRKLRLAEIAQIAE